MPQFLALAELDNEIHVASARIKSLTACGRPKHLQPRNAKTLAKIGNLGPSFVNSGNHGKTSQSHFTMMALLDGRAEDARPLFQGTIDFRKTLRAGMQHPVLAYGHIGMALIDLSNLEGMERELQNAERILQRLPADTTLVVERLASFGDTFRYAGAVDRAEILYTYSLKFHDTLATSQPEKFGLLPSLFQRVQQNFARSDSYAVGRASLGLGHCLLERGDKAQAAPHFERAVRVFEQQLGADDQRTVEARELVNRR